MDSPISRGIKGKMSTKAARKNDRLTTEAPSSEILSEPSFKVVGINLRDKAAAQQLILEGVQKRSLVEGCALPGMSTAFLEAWDPSLPKPIGSSTTESVLNHDDRVWISDASQEPYRWICYLSLTTSRGIPMLGTGWLIGPRTVVTAGHCIYNHDPKYGIGVMSEISVFAGRNRNQSLAQASVVSVETTQEWIDSERNTAFDFGVLYLDKPIGDDVGTLGFANFSDDDLANMTINVVGYPADKANGTLWGHVNKGIKVSPQRIAYRNDTYGGESGSAVIYWDGSGDFLSVGIHNYGIDPTDASGPHNYATRINRSIFDQLQAWKK